MADNKPDPMQAFDESISKFVPKPRTGELHEPQSVIDYIERIEEDCKRVRALIQKLTDGMLDQAQILHK